MAFSQSQAGCVHARTFFERFGHQGIIVLPDTVLSDDSLTDPDTDALLPSLREQVSLVDGVYHRQLCYARVLSPCGDGLYWATVAATLDFSHAVRIILTEENLYAAIPYDIRVQGKCSSDIIKLMAVHARHVRPAQRIPSAQTSEQTAPVQPQQAREEPTLIPLPEIFVSTQSVEEARAETPELSGVGIPSYPTAWARMVWLRAALAMVRRQAQHARHAFNKLDVLLDKVLDAQRDLRQSLVSASPVHVGDRLVGWRLQIALPLVEVLV